MKLSGHPYFVELQEIHTGNLALRDRYARMRTLLEQVCRALTSNEGLEFANLFSRLNYVCSRTKIGGREKYQINTFRVHANKVLHDGLSLTEAQYLQDLKAFCKALAHFSETAIPAALAVVLPAQDLKSDFSRPQGQLLKRVRIAVTLVDDTFIYGQDEDAPHEEEVKIRHHEAGINDAFNSTVDLLYPGAQLNLAEVIVDKEGIYHPAYIILEPDYLLDISSLAECFKEEGTHPANFVRAKLETIPNKHYLLLGNVANLFLDELVNETPSTPVHYAEVLQKSFKASPFEYSTCEDMPADFSTTCQSHFQSIKEILDNQFVGQGIAREKAVLEPSFICEVLGLQGRLDLMQEDFSRIVELKSGSATFPDEKIKENNYVQTLLYYAVLHFNIEKDETRRSYVLYSKIKKLIWGPRLDLLTKQALNKRNHIVATERAIALDRSCATSRQIIANINPETIITKALNPKFLHDFILPQIESFRQAFLDASPLESTYFHYMYTFTCREHYISKAGSLEQEAARSISALWNLSVKEKQETGEILTDLKILKNNAGTDATIEFSIPDYGDNFLPNFRKGDIVNLYERNAPEDTVTTKIVFKGAIEELTPNQIKVSLRFRQHNHAILPLESRYVTVSE